jgi:N-formylglutamate amidohydrolase
VTYFDHLPFARPGWEITQGAGPVLATAVHAGHVTDPDLEPRYKLSGAERRREEDPMTGLWASVGDHSFRCFVSRFQVDLNRSREKAVYMTPDDAWGLDVWQDPPSEQLQERILKEWDQFYALMSKWIEHLIGLHGQVVVLDVHSYNHRRDGAFSAPSPQEENPDIDLGVTTADPQRFGHLVDALHEELASRPAAGRKLDVRRNVRYPDGGHWPEWVFDQYGDEVATVTLEYKKFYMDEWQGSAYLPVVEDLRQGLAGAADRLRQELRR